MSPCTVLHFALSYELSICLESAVNCQPSHRGEALSAEAQLSYASKNFLKTIKTFIKNLLFFQKNSIFANFQTPKTYLKFI